MYSYIVSFQVSSEETLTRLRAKLKTFRGYCPINHTCWAVITDKRAREVRDELVPVLERDDRIFVVRSGTEAAWRNAISDKHSAWLKKNL